MFRPHLWPSSGRSTKKKWSPPYNMHRGGAEVKLCSIFNTDNRRGGWSTLHKAVLLPRKEPRYPVGLEDDLDRCGKNRPPTGFEPQTVQIVVSRYTAHAIKAPRWLPISIERESDKPMHLQALCHTFYLNTFHLAYPAAWGAISHWTSMQHRTTLLTESQAFLKSINSGWTSPLYLHFITHTCLSWFQASAAV